mmetsp:Transcript_26943/g.48700  ORF Transcript_26943/g.48700 Transcript_26943/m.48700 type:complete len:132 (-) Transcript_26943:76-471(-)
MVVNFLKGKVFLPFTRLVAPKAKLLLAGAKGKAFLASGAAGASYVAYQWQGVKNALHIDTLTDAEFKALFKQIDKDHNGFLEVKEIQEFLMTRGYALSDGEAKRMANSADKNGDGKISIEEFSAAVGRKNP